MENELNSNPSPWPQAGDVVFQAGNDWFNACLNFGADGWNLYAIGYKEAADALVERVLETERGMDLFIYPIVFLYRHYLELRLKQLITAGRELLDQDSDLQRVHQLDVLWISCRSLLEEIWPQETYPGLDAVGDCIAQIAQHDPVATSFRYPATRDGQPSLPTLRHVNIPHLHDVMKGVAALLEAATTGISAYLDDKWSMHESMR